MSAVYHGMDIHAYTQSMKLLVCSSFTNRQWHETMTDQAMSVLLTDVQLCFPGHVGVLNIMHHIRGGLLLDPELGTINILQVLRRLWELVVELKLQDHFKETLDQIGNTCMQGISHRLLIDLVAIGGY